MKNKTTLNRRKFLNVASLAATASVVPMSTFAQSFTPEADALPVNTEHNVTGPILNRIGEILEIKTICVEPGKFLGVGTEYGLDKNGHTVVTKKVMEPNRYIGWPTIVRTHTDELIVAFSGDRDGHICPFGKTQLITSNDNGKTWSEPRTITNTQLDDRDAGIIQTKKGTLLVSWFTSLAFERQANQITKDRYARIAEKIGDEAKKRLLGNWVRRSEDMGKTWGEPIRTVVTAPHGPISLKNGDLMYVGMGIWKDRGEVVAEKSTDDGKTWKTIGYLPKNPAFPTLSEPHVIELKSGKLLALVRNEPKDRTQCYLLQSESTDGGKIWTEMRSTGIWGYPPHLTMLKNGWLLVVYGCRREPFGIRACLSKDEGKTWDIANEINLGNAVNQDLGYPSSVQLSDGSILTVYYQAPKMGEPTVVMSTHWKI
ncbi:MAG: sialidase family protein [Pedobacter sp.]|nr:sialidase family protein [Pedobacter sp.]MDQ8052183.1 sialidase family protein [Pedobacter sp.]